MAGLSILLVIITWCSSANARRAPEHYDIFFVSVGSTRYAASSSADAKGLGDIRGANKSARLVAQLLERAGSRFGITLTSDSERVRYVGRIDVERALDRMLAEIRARGPRRPLLVFYVAGHGLSEGVGWNHFTIPGNLVLANDRTRQDIETLAGMTLHAAALVDRLNRTRMPYLVLLDTCYEAEARDFAPGVLTGTAVESLRAVAGVLRAINEFRQPHPVLFSTQPGTVASTVPDPYEPNAALPVAPLARRLAIVFDRASASGRGLTLAGLVRAMSDPSVDPIAGPAVTRAERVDDRIPFLPVGPQAAGSTEHRLGSTEGVSVCCTAAAPSEPASIERAASGRIDMTGSAGEFITEGRRVTLRAPPASMMLTQHSPGRASIEVQDDTGVWTLAFGTPDGGPMTARSYDAAQRFHFEDPGRPGLSVSGMARGCNSVKGQFTVERVRYGSDGILAELSARFTQTCDNLPATLHGTLVLTTEVGR